MSLNCGCGSNSQSIYATNMWNVNGVTSTSPCNHQQSCGGCLDITKSDCVAYTGSNLTNTGINKNDTLTAILAKLDQIKAIQDSKNAKILTALNDINTRLVALEGAPHDPYSLI